MREYLFQVRGQGVDELRQQLERMAADGQTALDRLSSAAKVLDGVAEGGARVASASASVANGVRTMAAETSTALNTLAGTAPAVSATAAQIKAVDTGARAAGGGLLALSAGAQAATGDAAALGQAMGSLDRLVVVQAGNVQLLTDQAGKASTALVAVGQAGTTAGTGLATVGEGMAVVAQGASGVARAADSLDILAESAGSTAAAVDNSVSMVKLFGYALVTWAGGAVIDNVLTHMERLRGATEDYRAELEQTAEAQNSASQALVGFAEHQAKISIARYALEGLGLGMASGILTLATRINLYVAAVAGLIEIAGKSVHAADELEQANASLADRLTRTGYTAGLTATQIQALALAQEGLTRQSAIQITGMAESLTGVRSLTAETFQPALKALQNLTSYMKGDAAAASKALATALDAPLTATSALEAADIRLDYQQREAIRSFEALNDRVGAHGVILAAVNDQTHHAAEAMDETERANKRLSDSWTHLKEAIGAGLGELGIKAREVGSIISSLIPSIPFGDWVADFNENLVGHLGTLPLETQLERATKRLEKAQADLATATKSYETDGGMMAFDMLQAAENSVAVMTQRVEAIRAKIAEAPPADKPAADDGAGRAERDRNAELLAGITRDQSQAFEQLVPPSAVERLKRINSELETTRTKIGNLRNKDGSNADAVAAQVAQAEAIAAQRAAKLLEMPSKGDEAERIKAVRDEASRLVTATRQLAREDGSNAGVITQTVQAIEKERDAKVALIREENQGKASKKDLVAVSDAEARGALALAAATLEGVDAAMQQAAANEAHKKALSDSTVAEDALRRALLERKAAETLQGGAQEVASLTKRADGLAQVAAAARDGAAAEADVELQVKAAAFAEEKLAAARVAGGGVFLDLAEREILAYDDLLKREQDLTRQREVNRTIAARQDALDLARQELALQDLSTEAKAVEIARLTAINDLKKYGNSLSAEQRQLYVDTAVAQAQQQQAAQAMQRIAETAKGYWNDVRGYIVDGLTEATKSGGKAFDDLWDAARKGLRRFLINAALDMAGQKLVLPVITPLVGAVSGAGGGQSPPVTIGGQSYVPVGQSGSGLMGQGSGGLTVGNVFSQASGGWLDRQLGGGITSASNWLNTTAYGGSAPTAEMMAGIDDVGQLGYAADAGGVTYGDMLGGAGYGIGAIMNFANGNTVAGIGQTAAAVMSFIPGLQVAAPFVAIAGQLLGGLFGKDRGPPAAAAAVQYNNSDQTYAASATDNEGDEQQAKELLSSIDAATRQFVTILGGRTAGEFGVAVEAKDDRYRVREGGAGGQLAGSYDTLDEAVIAGFRYNVSQGLIEASDEVLKAVQNSTSKDINEFMKDVALGKSIADATAGLKDLDQSLAGVAARAKEAQASQYKAVDAELERAQGLGLGDNYRSILEHQLRSTFLSAGQSFTSVEIAEAQYAAQTEATVEAVKRWNLSITEA
ncbi:hypothetical protein, partial [Azospirillum picis]